MKKCPYEEDCSGYPESCDCCDGTEEDLNYENDVEDMENED